MDGNFETPASFLDTQRIQRTKFWVVAKQKTGTGTGRQNNTYATLSDIFVDK